MKRILKASAAFALATTLIFSGAGMASATEEVTPTPEVSAEAQVTETPAPAVEEAVVPEEVAAPAPAEVVETPEVAPAPAAPQAEVTTTDAQPQAPPVAAKKPRETYVTALWKGTDVQWPKGGQTLVGSVKHDDKALNESWIKYQELKPCTVYQGDLYVDDATTAALLKGGKLYEPNKPKESWPGGTYQSSYSIVFKTDCAPALIEIPYPKLLANEVCGANNDPVFTDPEWVKQYGHLVAGPWIDTKYKKQNGKWVVDGSAQIKAEFRKTHIWAGTAGTDKSSYLRWQMYPGTAPFVHEDTATVCPPVEVPDRDLITIGTQIDCKVETLVINAANENDFEVTLTTGFDEDGDGTPDFGDGIVVPANSTGSITYENLAELLPLTLHVGFWAEEGFDSLYTQDLVSFECEVPPTEEPPVVTPPATETPKPTPAPVKAAVVDDSLAATGGELPLVLGGLGVLALIAGGVVIYLSRRKKATEVADSVDAE